jgi:putative flippase GtrA
MDQPTLLRRHRALAAEFFRFGTVGAIGYVTDTASVYALKGMVGVAAAGLLSFLVAATVTWALNRNWTWRDRGRGAPRLRQWSHFLAVNGPGALLNRGIYEALVLAVPLCATHPFLATGAGAIAGMFVNFGLSRRLVFR